MKTQRPRLRRGREQGFTLIEVLVAMLVLMVGILGIAGVQLVSFQNNQSAYLRSQATHIAGEFLDRIRANPQAHLTSAAYDAIDTKANAVPADQGCLDTSVGCTMAQLALQDVREWSNHFSNVYGATDYRPTLPSGRATVTREAGNLFTVRVFWSERDWDTEDNEDGSTTLARAGGIERSVELRTVLQ